MTNQTKKLISNLKKEIKELDKLIHNLAPAKCGCLAQTHNFINQKSFYKTLW